jgi:phage FluMu gp28-like protein
MIRFTEKGGQGALPGKVREVSFLGSMARYVVEMETGDRIQVDEHNPKNFRSQGSSVFLVLDEEALHLQKVLEKEGQS